MIWLIKVLFQLEHEGTNSWRCERWFVVGNRPEQANQGSTDNAAPP